MQDLARACSTTLLLAVQESCIKARKFLLCASILARSLLPRSCKTCTKVAIIMCKTFTAARIVARSCYFLQVFLQWWTMLTSRSKSASQASLRDRKFVGKQHSDHKMKVLMHMYTAVTLPVVVLVTSPSRESTPGTTSVIPSAPALCQSRCTCQLHQGQFHSPCSSLFLYKTVILYHDLNGLRTSL